jgi:DNA-directed RNA polymerase specialized sigma24 family protein
LRAERDGSLEEALDALPLHQRRLMQLLLAEPELSYRDVAERLGIPIGSIGPTRARALERLARDARLAGVGE